MSAQIVWGKTGLHTGDKTASFRLIVYNMVVYCILYKRPKRIACEHFAYSHYTAQGPDVWFTAMALLVEHLGGQIVGSSADRLPPVPCWLQLGSQTKVPDLQLHRLTHKKVTCGQETEREVNVWYLTQDQRWNDGLIKKKRVGMQKVHNHSKALNFTVFLGWYSLPSFRSLWRISCSCRYLSPDTICRR